jgi:hypothetical protein
MILIATANVLVMPPPDASSDMFASVRANLPASQQNDFDSFMGECMDLNGIFENSEADLVAMNDKFGEFYLGVIDSPMLQQARSSGWMVWAQYVSMGTQHDYCPVLEKVGAPVLSIHSSDD